MNYNNLYIEFMENIPESVDFCRQKEKDSLIDETVGTHISFGLVFVPYVLQIINRGEIMTINRVFEFMENMAICDDIKVRELLDFTILEQLADEGHDVLNQCKKFMGPETLLHCEEVEKYYY